MFDLKKISLAFRCAYQAAYSGQKPEYQKRNQPELDLKIDKKEIAFLCQLPFKRIEKTYPDGRQMILGFYLLSGENLNSECGFERAQIVLKKAGVKFIVKQSNDGSGKILEIDHASYDPCNHTAFSLSQANMRLFNRIVPLASIPSPVTSQASDRVLGHS